jgi:hypothetical protein
LDAKHRQRYYRAITSFRRAESIIVEQLPPDLQQGATDPEGPSRTDCFCTGSEAR